MTASRADIARDFRWQAGWCERLGSPLYHELLEHAAAEIEHGGPTGLLLDDPATADPERDGALPGARALRLMGAIHRLVLDGEAPGLARHYPSAGGRPRDGVRAAFSDVVEARRADLALLMQRPVQTNEPGRSAGLLGGFLEVARAAGLPLRLLEVGASAGLNLRWDRFAYAADGFAWGAPDSPLRLEFELEGTAPALPASVEVAERRGCDANPIDATTAEGRLSLLSFVWPDQPERIARMEAALAVAGEEPVALERETASTWAQRMLAEPTPGRATVIYHSIVSQYLSDEERAALFDGIREAGARATDEAPLAWLRMEPADDRANLELTLWPGGEDRLLARVGYHGSPVELT